MNPNTWAGIAIRLIVIVLVVLMFTANASAEWKEKVLYSFQGIPDGAIPAGGVVFDKASNLYGVTTDGGSGCPTSQSGCGTIFELSPATGGTWTETILYGFDGTHGSYPAGSVIIDSAGNLYGTTTIGGNGQCKLLGYVVGCGVVYELSPPTQKNGQWTYAVLYNFQGGNDGLHPVGDLVLDKQGKLYGATWYGGGKGTTCDQYYGGNCGTVFELTPPKKNGGAWKEQILHSFAGGTAGKKYGDGAQPNGGLLLDTKGAIYGTTYFGGNEGSGCNGGSGGTGCGTVFKLVPPTKKGRAWTEGLLYLFKGVPDGVGPSGGAVRDSRGNLYGVTNHGGSSDEYGVAYRLWSSSGSPDAWAEQVIYDFTGRSDGGSPAERPVFGAGGDLYGTAYGGDSHLGVVYRLKPPKHGGSWSVATLYNFTGPPDASEPGANVTFDKVGNLYSTTQYGGTGNCYPGGCGTVFEVTP